MLEPASHRPGTVLGGKFRVERVLGAGGMGAVYEVTHTVTRHRRALKLLHPRMAANDEIVERFLREASAAGRIGDPHIVETFDGGRLPSGEPYVLLELLQGVSLADRLRGTAGLSVIDTLDVVAQACDGTEAANRAGIIHRDLKPDNLFLCEREGRPFVKLLDFGVSRFDPKTSVDKVTVGGGLIGTPFYMAPEQMRGDRDLDARADVYALGVITWECLTNTLPYAARDVVRLVGEVLSDKEPRLDQVRPELPPALVELVALAMKKDREQRLATAQRLGDALRELAAALGPAHAALGASALAETGLASTGVAIAATPADRVSDPLGATVGAETQGSGAVRLSTAEHDVDPAAATLAPVPQSTPMPVSQSAPTSTPATKPARSEETAPPKAPSRASSEAPPASQTASPASPRSPSRLPLAVGGIVVAGASLVAASWLATEGDERAAARPSDDGTATATSSASSPSSVGPDVPLRAVSSVSSSASLELTSTVASSVATAASAQPSAIVASPTGPSATSASALRSSAPPATGTLRAPSAKPSSPIAGKGEFPGG